MILTAPLLDTADRCEQRLAFEREWQPRAITGMEMLYAAVEAALTTDDSAEAARAACRTLSLTREIESRGLPPYAAIRHIGFLAETVALALRQRLGLLRSVESVRFGPHRWDSRLFEADGQAHRIALCSYLDDDTLRAFAHSWLTLGELAALERDIHLTVVAVGPQRSGRRHSAWSKGFLHPTNHQLRFGRRQNKSDGLNAGWQEVWREYSAISAGEWLKAMEDDGLLEQSIVTHAVTFDPTDERIRRARAAALQLAERLEQEVEGHQRRYSACDDPIRGSCPFQAVCWDSAARTPADFPQLYQPRDTPPTTPAAHTCSPNTSSSSRPVAVFRKAPSPPVL